jgi:putative transposase
MRKAFKYRLYPTPKQDQQLTTILDRCRELYNAGLEERREAYRMAGKSLTCTQQQAELPGLKEDRPEYRLIDAQVLQDVLKRLDRAFAAFFRRVKAGQVPGFPRYKGRDRYDSVTFHQTGWKIVDGRLSLRSVAGPLKVKLHRPVQGTIKAVTLKRECGHWYAVFISEIDAVPLPALDTAVGIDLGLIDFLMTDTGEPVPAPQYFRRGEAVLARRQHVLSRKRRGSHRRRKAKRLVAKAHRHVANQRRDFHHKTAHDLVQAYGIICHEDLRIANMVQNPYLAKSISDAGWAQFIAILTAKAEEAGRVTVAVNPRGTSQTCPCGEPVPKGLSDRWHHCPRCHLSLPRDQVSAIEKPSGDTAFQGGGEWSVRRLGAHALCCMVVATDPGQGGS